MKWYKCVSAYGWYTKVMKKIQNQKLRYTKRYTKISVYERYTSQKKPYKVVYRPFFCRVAITPMWTQTRARVVIATIWQIVGLWLQSNYSHSKHCQHDRIPLLWSKNNNIVHCNCLSHCFRHCDHVMMWVAINHFCTLSQMWVQSTKQLQGYGIC